MASNIEDFLIRFVFEDEAVVKKIKDVSKSMDRLEKTSEKSYKRQQSQTKSKQNNLKKENTLLSRQKQLRSAIHRAEDLGIKSSGFKNTLSVQKDPDKLRNRTLQLEKQITEERRKQQLLNRSAPKDVAKPKENELSLLRAEQQLREKIARADTMNIDVSAQKEVLKSQSDINTLRREDLKLRERIRQETQRQRVMDQMSRVRSSAAFQTVSKMDNPRATQYATEMQAALNRQTREGQRVFNTLNRKLQETARQMRRVRTDAINLRTAQKGLQDSTRNMIRSYVSLFAVFAGAKSINRTGQDFEALNSSMLAAMGTIPKAQEEVAFLERLTRRLGVSLLETSNAYAKLTYSAKQDMSTEEVRTLFTGLTEFGTVMGLDQERMKWSMMAVQQIK